MFDETPTTPASELVIVLPRSFAESIAVYRERFFASDKKCAIYESFKGIDSVSVSLIWHPVEWWKLEGNRRDPTLRFSTASHVMSRGPRGERRPADAIGCAVMVAKIATGEAEEAISSSRHERARLGGKARMSALSQTERSDIGKRAAGARWKQKEASMSNDCTTELAALYERKAAAGLLDAKFFLRRLNEAATEEVCRDVLRFNRAIEDGKVEPLDFGDLRWREVDKT